MATGCVDTGCALLLLFAPLLLGGRHPLGRLVFVALIGIVVLGWLWGRAAAQPAAWRRTGLEWLLGLAGAVLVLQVTPLSATWLARLSPELSQVLIRPDAVQQGQAAPTAEPGAWTTVSLEPEATRSGLVLLASYCMLLTVLTQRLDGRPQVERLLRWLALAAVGLSVLSLAQVAFGNGRFLWVYEHPFRSAAHVARGPFANQNHLAHFLALAVGPLVCCLYAARRTPWQAALWTLGLGLVLLTGLLTFSRAGIAVLGLATVTMLLLLARVSGRGRNLWGPALVVGSCLILAIGVFGHQRFVDEFESLVASRSAKELLAGRAVVWQAVQRAVADFPLLGTGAGTHAVVCPLYLARGLDTQYTHAESGYLQVLEETGVVGLALLLVAMVTVGRWCLAAWRRSETPRDQLLAGAVGVSLLLSGLHATVDFVWYIPACMTATVLLIACARQLGGECVRPSIVTAGEAAAPRLVWGTAAVAATLLVGAACRQQWRPAVAARYWDQYTRLSAAAAHRTDSAPIWSDEAAAMLACLEQAARADQRDARVHCRLAALYLQRFEAAQQQAENRLGLAQIRDAAVLSKFPSPADLHAWLQRAVGQSREDLLRADAHARRAVQLSPLHGEAYVYLAQLGFLHGAGNQSKDHYLRQAVRVRPVNSAVLLAVGGEWALAGNWRGAVECWRQVYRQGPPHRAELVRLLAPRVPAAFFLQTFAPDRDGSWQLFCHYRQLGLDESAREVGRYWLQQTTGKPAGSGSAGANASADLETLRQAVAVYDLLGQDQAATEALRCAVTQVPSDFATRHQLARRLLQAKCYDEARTHLQWCRRRQPHNAAIEQDLRLAVRGMTAGG